MDSFFLIVPLFFTTALVYSLVGFAGGSTYLALLALFSFPYEQLPVVALACNLIVSAGGVWHFSRHRFLDWRRVLPFFSLSIPMSFWGGSLHVEKNVFLFLLGLSLLVASVRLFFVFSDEDKNSVIARTALPDEAIQKGITGLLRCARNDSSHFYTSLFIGAALGFLSGLVGIGGGIFLSPILYLTRWGNARQISAACSLFILVNSLSGIMGHLSKGTEVMNGLPVALPLVLAAFLGGQIGSRLATGRLSLMVVQRTTALLILAVSVQIFWRLM